MENKLPAERTAIEAAQPEHSTPMARRLALSLSCYASDDDQALDRRTFLTYVRDRIDIDLKDGTY